MVNTGSTQPLNRSSSRHITRGDFLEDGGVACGIGQARVLSRLASKLLGKVFARSRQRLVSLGRLLVLSGSLKLSCAHCGHAHPIIDLCTTHQALKLVVTSLLDERGNVRFYRSFCVVDTLLHPRDVSPDLKSFLP